MCDRLASCSPAVEAVLALITISIGIGLTVHPGLMAGSRALVELLDYMPQGWWAMTFLGVGSLKLLAVLYARKCLRALALTCGLLLWSHMAYVTGAETGQAVLAPWLYGPLAFFNFAAIVSLGWELGQPHRVR